MAKLPKFPLEFNGQRIEKRNDPPLIGNAGKELLKEIGMSVDQRAKLEREGVVKL